MRMRLWRMMRGVWVVCLERVGVAVRFVFPCVLSDWIGAVVTHLGMGVEDLDNTVG